MIGNFYMFVRIVLQKGVWGPCLVVAIELEVFFWAKSIWIWVLWGGFDTLCDVGENLLDAKHSVGIQPGVSVWARNAREKVLPRLQDE